VTHGIPDAIILAGGLGTRLREVVHNKQKIMAEVDGKPFVAYLFRKLAAAGIRRVILALGYRGEDAFTEALLHKPNDIALVASMEPEPLGTAGALRNAMPYVQTPEVLVTNGDSIVDYPLARFLDFHHNAQATASMLLCEVPDAARYGRVLLRESSSEVATFAEKFKSAKGGALINAGVYILPTALVTSLPPGPRSFETDVLPGLCDGRLHGLATQARFLDIGVPEDYRKAPQFFESMEQTL
jgi:D-glycero-alpha-D-manno-heptose 1-phosphate guanylyltransferase